MCVATLIIFKNRGAVIYQYVKSKKIIFPYEILKWKTKNKKYKHCWNNSVKG